MHPSGVPGTTGVASTRLRASSPVRRDGSSRLPPSGPFIDRPTRVDFQRSGTYNVLVVSGMNVSILAIFTLWTLRRLALGDVAASAAAITLILAYAALTKEGLPVWRAALVFAVYLATRLLYRDRAMLNTVGAAGFALLIADPDALFGASFQMSFLCVGLVAGVGIPLLERTIEPFSRGLRNLDALHLQPLSTGGRCAIPA